MPKKIRTIFMGTPELSAVALQTLINDGRFEIILTVTQKDQAVGRHLQIKKSPVKVLAENNHLKISQPEKIKEIEAEIKELNPDLIVVVAYGQIIPSSILNTPQYGCLNVHGSLLPKYRGASCIQATILNNDAQGGITIMKMDEKMDTGDIIEKIAIDLEKNETSQSLMEKIKEITSNHLPRVIIDFIAGKITAKKQDESLASYVKLIKKTDGRLDFTQTATEIERKIRAYFPWPGTFAYLEADNLPKKEILFKILGAGEMVEKRGGEKNGQLVVVNEKIGVTCSDKILIIDQLQVEGKNATAGKDFLKGNPWIIGKILK